MEYNFDELVDRSGTHAYKIERCKEVFGTADVLPLWVADMDFRTPDFILDAIAQRCKHPVLGYTVLPDDYFPDVAAWISARHNWHVSPEWMGFVAGIVPGLAFAVNAFTRMGDEVIIQPPIYPPFQHIPANNGRKIVFNPLHEEDGLFTMDFDDLERKISSNTKLFVLCNPHNPGGRVWPVETLQRVAEICARYGVLVISDEIHADMVLPGSPRHVPFASVSDVAAQNSITFMAPSKTFNMPGLASSFYVIPNKHIRRKMNVFMENSELNLANLLAIVASQAAYNKGNEWREQMLRYVKANVDFVVDFMQQHLPRVRVMRPQASFLLWLDFSAYGIESERLQRLMVEQAHLGLNQGTDFGPGGEMHLRLNIATPRSVLADAMQRMQQLLDNIN